jgi:hypothetical protein
MAIARNGSSGLAAGRSVLLSYLSTQLPKPAVEVEMMAAIVEKVENFRA